MNQPPHKPNQRLVWTLVLLMLFSAFMLVWLNAESIQDQGAKLRTTTVQEVVTTKEVTTSTTSLEESTVTVGETTEQLTTSQEVTTTSPIEETTTTRELSLKEQYDLLPDPQEYSIYQYYEDRIEDLHVKRGFEVMIQRLKDEGKYYSTVDYHLTFYPTLDENISNVALDEYYADRVVHRGHYRFDYRAKEMLKY